MQPTQVPPSALTEQTIKMFEGCILHPYLDNTGKWTIAYGSRYDLAGNPVTAATPVMTQEEAEQLFQVQLQQRADTVDQSTNPASLNDNQRSACISLCWNIGQPSFAGSTVAHMCREGNFGAAADAFLLWDKDTVNGILVVDPELLARREKERALFLATN